MNVGRLEVVSLLIALLTLEDDQVVFACDGKLGIRLDEPPANQSKAAFVNESYILAAWMIAA